MLALGRYDILGSLAVGGMAELFLGVLNGPSGFQRLVVIKQIRPQYARDEQFVEMFIDEARIIAGIRHPNVVQCFELNTEDDNLFLVMEYLEGESSDGLLRRLRRLKRPLDLSHALHIVADTAAGLHAAHELRTPDGQLRELVHRDVSPDNIFIGYDGSVKLLDFGVAKASDRITQTEAGMLKGKFSYMSPEQARGESLDRRSDIFGLGIVLWELVCGRRLFLRGNTIATLRAIEKQVIPPPSEVVHCPVELDRIVLRALERDRERRYASAHDFRRDLLRLSSRLDGDEIPDEHLSRLMQSLFHDRIEEKQRLLSAVEARRTPGPIPEPNIDEDVSLPTWSGETMRESVHEPRRMRSMQRLLAIIAAVVIASAFWVGWKSDSSPVIPAIAEAANESDDRAREPEESQVQEVEIRVVSTPEANVEWGDELKGRTPIVFSVPRAADQVPLVITEPGYQAHQIAVTPSESHHFDLTLRAERSSRSRRRGMRTRMRRDSTMSSSTAMDDYPVFQ